MNEQQLSEAAVAALERSAFVFAEPLDDTGAPPADALFASIRVTGSVRGELHLAASQGFLRELAASLLGVEASEVDPGAHGADALKEMANMIAGSVVVHYGGEDRAYTLGLPELSLRAEFERAAPLGMRASLCSEGEPLSMVWVDASAGVREAA
jgi:hypothetical protein